MTIVDRDEVPALQICRDIFDPVQCSLIEGRLSSRLLRNRHSLGVFHPAVDQNKLVILKADKFFPARAD